MTEPLRAEQVFRTMDSLAYVGGRPAGSAVIKQQFSDFRVDEDLGFEPSGRGEHLYLQLRKQNISTTELARRLAESTGAGSRDVGYSGMKDRRGECSQWFSIRLAPEQETELASLESDAVQILQTRRNHRKLRVGSHRANHFHLLLRDCHGDKNEFEQQLQVIRERGVPNYFGPQRFGRRLSNLQQVRDLFAAGAKGASKGRSRNGFGNNDALNKGERQQDKRKKRGMLYSAARAYLFNEVLSARLAAGNWARYVPGDVLNLDGTNRNFSVAEGEWDETLQHRLETFDIHLTGPLAGISNSQDKYLPGGAAADIEKAVLDEYPRLVSGLQEHGLLAARRALRFRVADLNWHWPAPDQLELRFVLPRGAYATSLLREVCKISEGEDHRI
jgi:tRNA pseudouridine13 synthase